MTESVSRWSRRYVLVSVAALVCWQASILLDAPRQTEVVLGVFGFVLHMIFGKAYALIPSYFDRDLVFARGPILQFPLVVGGAVGFATASFGAGPAWLSAGSAMLWSLGVVVFVGTLLWTIGDALLEGATGTGDHNVDRLPVDRLANVFVPVALLYLLVGSYQFTALYGPLPPVIGGVPAQVSHLLAAGTGALLVFALGFRLLPRFLGTYPSVWAVRFVLPAGALGPVLIAAGFSNQRFLIVGAVLEAAAVTAFAVTFLRMFHRSDRRRVGFYGVAAGSAFGVAGVLLGIYFALRGATTPLIVLHFRLNVLGFLGLTIVGLAYQFYPPSVGTLPGSSDRTALVSILGICLGLTFHAGSVGSDIQAIATVGSVFLVISSIVYAYLVLSAFGTRR